MRERDRLNGFRNLLKGRFRQLLEPLKRQWSDRRARNWACTSQRFGSGIILNAYYGTGKNTQMPAVMWPRILCAGSGTQRIRDARTRQEKKGTMYRAPTER